MSDESDQTDQSHDDPNTCSACLEQGCDWQWDAPELAGHYCIKCVAESIRNTIIDPAELWPPRIENVPIPVEEFAERLNGLDGVPLVQGELELDEGVEYPWDGLMASFRECDLYRAIANPDHRIVCPHRRIPGPGRPAKLIERQSDDRCNHFIWRRERFVEGEPHIWRRCTWCESYHRFGRN